MASFTLRIDDHLKRQIKKHAAEEDISMNAWIQRALEDVAFHEEPNLDATDMNRFDSTENMVGYCAAGIENNCDINNARFDGWEDAEHVAGVYLDYIPASPAIPRTVLNRIDDLLYGMKIAEQFYKPTYKA